MFPTSNSTQILAYKKTQKHEKKPTLILSNFSVRTDGVFKKKYFFTPKNRPEKLLIIGPTHFFHSPAQTTAHSPKLIFHIMKSRNQTSVLLSVEFLLFFLVCSFITCILVISGNSFRGNYSFLIKPYVL